MSSIKKLLYFLLPVLLSVNAFAQKDRTQGSLQNILKKNPSDIYTQKSLLYHYVKKADTALLKRELAKAGETFKNNEDYSQFVKVNTVYIDIIKGNTELATKKIGEFEKNLSPNKNFPLTTFTINSIKGYLQTREGNHQLALENYEKITNTINENKLEKKHFVTDYLNYGNTLIGLGQYEKELQILFETVSTKREIIYY